MRESQESKARQIIESLGQHTLRLSTTISNRQQQDTNKTKRDDNGLNGLESRHLTGPIVEKEHRGCHSKSDACQHSDSNPRDATASLQTTLHHRPDVQSKQDQ